MFFGENSDFRALDETAVVGVQAKIHQVFDKRRIRRILVSYSNRPGSYIESGFHFEAVELELNLRVFQGHVRAALNVRTAFTGIVERRAVHCDAHLIQCKGIFHFNLAGQWADVNALVIIDLDPLIVNHLHPDARNPGRDKAAIHHIVGLYIPASIELGLLRAQAHLFTHRLHGPACARHGQTDIITINRCCASIQSFIAGIAGKPQAHMALITDFIHDAPQFLGISFRYHRPALFEQDSINGSAGRFVDFRYGFSAGGIRAQLRFVRQVLQGIIVPELDFYPPVHGPAPLGIIRCQRSRRPPALAGNDPIGQGQTFLDRQCSAPRHGFGEPVVVSVNALVPALQRHIVGISDELDSQMLFTAQIAQGLTDLLEK